MSKSSMNIIKTNDGGKLFIWQKKKCVVYFKCLENTTHNENYQ